MRNLKFRKIQNRLSFFLLTGYILFFLIISISHYLQTSSGSLEKDEIKLAALLDIKASEIDSFIKRATGDVENLASRRKVRQAGSRLVAGPSPAARLQLQNEFQGFTQNYDFYYEIFLVSASTGYVLYSTIEKNIGLNFSQNPFILDTIRMSKTRVGDIYFSRKLNIPTMLVTAPLRRDGNLSAEGFGVIALRIYLERTIYNSLLARKGLGDTGEFVIAGKKNLVFSPLRDAGGPPLTIRINDIYLEKAARGERGVITCRDYRNRKVLAAYGRILSTEWKIAAKQDISELKKGAVSAFFSELIIFMVIGVIILFLTFLLSRDITAPIYRLIRVVNQIKKGDYTFRLKSQRYDEFKQLYRSFNGMADIITSQLMIKDISSEIIQVMVTTLSLDEFSRSLLHELVKKSNSIIGAFYILTKNGNEFKHLASIGLDIESMESFHAESLEGEFGRALATRELTVTKNISKSKVIKVRSIAGDIVPEEIITVPVVVNNRTVAIISLASIHPFDEEILTVINQIRPVMNMALANILSDEETRKLAKELSEKNLQLEMKKRELEKQAEELSSQRDMVKLQNRELEEQHKKVEEANRLKTEFLSNMSHELRTPLNSIMALSRVLKLQAGKKFSDEEADYMDIIERNGAKLLSLINDILDLSRIESGRIDLRIKKLSLESVIGIILDNHEYIAEEKGVSLQSSFPSDMPMIESDESRVFQIFQNIISNAVKFTEKGSVAVIAELDGEEALVFIRDTGIGIEESALPGIFEEFRQIDGTHARKYEGTGLGLAIAARSAELINASINVESAPGLGTSFTLRIPLRWPGTDENTRSFITFSAGSKIMEVAPIREHKKEYSGPREGTAMAETVNRPTVMIIDDDKDNIIVVQAVLKDIYRVPYAYDGQDAMEMIRKSPPDLVLLDMSLPGKSGFIVARELKQEDATRRIPLIALTALTMPGDRERILSAGCDDYIAKPYNIDHLKQKIEEWLSK